MQREMTPPTPPNAEQTSDWAQVRQYLRQRFVALPDPSSTNGWLVDFRDPFHPVTRRYATWAAAQDAEAAAIAQCLREQFDASELS